MDLKPFKLTFPYLETVDPGKAQSHKWKRIIGMNKYHV